MNAFVALFSELDRTTSLLEKQAALTRYFGSAPPADGAWAVALLSGRRPKKPLTRRELIGALCEHLGIEEWLFTESYEAVGDLGETTALMIDTLKPRRRDEPADDAPLAVWMEERLPALRDLDEAERRRRLIGWWETLDPPAVFLLMKLIGGSFRVGASEALVVKALAEASGLPVPTVTQRLTGSWAPTAAFFERLVAADDGTEERDPGQPYPFALAYPLDQPPEALGGIADWSAEWKWDGIRAQIVRRSGQCQIWSRGEDMVTGAFPELRDAAVAMLPDGTVLDGEILVFEGDRPLPFAALQKRLGRKKVTAAMLASTPVRFLAYDLLELAGVDRRADALALRRADLESLIGRCSLPLGLSPLVAVSSWEALAAERAEARTRGVEGLMLKRRDAPYRAGRRKGDWWKWKVEPLVIDAVLMYAQAGSGRRANLFTDYSFGVWRDGALVTVAKAYSGLDQAEIGELDRWIRAHTVEKFGPVRSVEPAQVFELGFEGIQASGRHKAGLALRFPRILRWRKDKPPAEADSLESVRALLHAPD